MTPTIGRIVHFVQQAAYDPARLIHLPAIVVAVWGTTCVNLQVFTDGPNSEPNVNPPGTKWITSVTLNEAGDQPYTWHWPEKE